MPVKNNHLVTGKSPCIPLFQRGNKSAISNTSEIKLNPLLVRIGKMADELDLKAYIVGGAVRDLIIGKKDVDLDVTCEGNPEALVKAAAKLIKGQVKSYPQFGTFSVQNKSGLKIDFATARKETYARSGALPKVAFSNLEDDISRRDFTVNSLAALLNGGKTGEVIDLFCGKRDLKNKILRVLHEKSFKDDPTRIFRLARFASRGFKIDRLTEKLAVDGVRYIRNISPERRLQELLLVIEEKEPYKALDILKKLGVTEKIIPGIDISPRLLKLRNIKTVEGRLAFLLSGACRDLRRKIYLNLRFSNKLKNAVEKPLEPVKLKAALNGRDLIAMGYKQGPQFKVMLESLANSGISSRGKAKKFIFDNFPQKI